MRPKGCLGIWTICDTSHRPADACAKHFCLRRRAIREALDDGPSQDIADNLDTLNLLSAPSQVGHGNLVWVDECIPFESVKLICARCLQNLSQDIEMAAAYCSPRRLTHSMSALQADVVSPREASRVIERRSSVTLTGRHPNDRPQPTSNSQLSP